MIALYKCMKNIKSSQSFDLLNEHLKIYTIHEKPGWGICGPRKKQTWWEAERTQISDVNENIRLWKSWGYAERNLYQPVKETPLLLQVTSEILSVLCTSVAV